MSVRGRSVRGDLAARDAAARRRRGPAGAASARRDSDGRSPGERRRSRKATREKKSEPPPLPYSLADLQVDAGRALGLTPKQTLDACQALYETHRLITYPRSDCSYLPEGHLAQAAGVLGAIATNAPISSVLHGSADRSRRSRAWNDAKVTAHHAIIPTPVTKSRTALSAANAASTTSSPAAISPSSSRRSSTEETRSSSSSLASGSSPKAGEPSGDGWQGARRAWARDDEETEQTRPGRMRRATPLPVAAKAEQHHVRRGSHRREANARRRSGSRTRRSFRR